MKQQGICRIICAGERTPLGFVKADGDLTIAADGGYDHALEAGIVPDILLGDLDSIEHEPCAGAVRLDPVKDLTDTFAAVETGLERGYRRFELHCAGGGRLSHTLANIAVLRYLADKGAEGTMYFRGGRAYICRGRAEVRGNVYFSLFPEKEAAEADISGAKYSGSFTFTDSDSLGVSNEPLENKTAVVTVRGGGLIMIEEIKD